MSCNFLFANFIAHVKNCIIAKLKFADFRHSNFIYRICDVLKADGYITEYKEFFDKEGKKFIRVVLSYNHGVSVIQDIHLVSKPSRRVYTQYKNIKPFRNGLGLIIISTSLGVLSYREAIKRNVGGEVLCRIF